MTVDLDELRARFARDVKEAGAPGASEATFERLVTCYGEPHRHYHDLTHLEACLAWLDWCGGLAERREEVALALWFHDAVYDPTASDNEQRSAELARTELEALGVPGAVVERVADHILATAEHVGSGDAALVVDLDLTILAARPSEYERFEQQIRREYANVSAELFRAGRRKVLERFLARSSIYRVPALRDALERRARRNLEQRIAELSD